MKPQIYAVFAKDRDIVTKSSSGGAFTVLSDYFLENGDAVVCTRFNYESTRLIYTICTLKSQRDACRGSVYFQSIMGDIVLKTKTYLEKNSNKKVLMVGMPCQLMGAKKSFEYLGLSDRITYCELICHGVPSGDFFKMFVPKKKKLTYLTFKGKENSWLAPSAYAKFGNRRVSLVDYVDLFYQGYSIRPSCYECQYACKQRVFDLTIGDFWGIQSIAPEFFNKDGTSLLIVNSEKGAVIFDHVSGNFEILETDFDSCVRLNLQPNLQHPTQMPADREEFWKGYYNNRKRYIARKWSRVKQKTKIKNFIKKCFRTFHLVLDEGSFRSGTEKRNQEMYLFGDDECDLNQTQKSTCNMIPLECIDDAKLTKLYTRKSDCCGCGACAVCCPECAILMNTDKEGFIYPFVNELKCKNCKICVKICQNECIIR